MVGFKLKVWSQALKISCIIVLVMAYLPYRIAVCYCCDCRDLGGGQHAIILTLVYRYWY